MKRKSVDKGIFILSIICLIISIGLFINHGIFADEFNTSVDVINGGSIWLMMDWVRLGVSIVICILSGINLFRKEQV